MGNIPTPHIKAEYGDFAKKVLMPGDPLRAKRIVDNFLTDAVLVNNVRGVNGYTGFYKGERVSVMASGMGIPSMGIYSYELFNYYGVETIIRVGSAGAVSKKMQLRDLVLGMGACTDSNYAASFGLPGTFAPIADYSLLKRAVDLAEQKGLRFSVGNLLSTDTFYNRAESTMAWEKMGVLAVEMECAALYMNAAAAGKKALCICTISDLVFSGEQCTAEERQNSFVNMIDLALDI